MKVDPGFAQWLRDGTLRAALTDAQTSARWGATAGVTDIVSALALKVGADAEAARQLAFLGGPLVEDTLVVPGLRRDLMCQPHRDGDEVVFVIGYDEGDDNGPELTTLTVLRRMM